MLEQSRLPIEEIAHETGFGDRERMRRSFMRAFGQSPQSVRNGSPPLVATSSVSLGVSHTTHEVHLEMPGELGRARLTGDRERSPVFWAHRTAAAPA